MKYMLISFGYNQRKTGEAMFQTGAKVPKEGGREGVGWGERGGETGEKNNAHFMALYFCTQPQHNSPNVYHSEKCSEQKLQRRAKQTFYV